MTEKCGAIGALTVGGRVVGQIKCDKHAGHDETEHAETCEPCRRHAVTLTWTPETEPDLDLFDPAERFDIEVPESSEPERRGDLARCAECGAEVVSVGHFAPLYIHRYTADHAARVD